NGPDAYDASLHVFESRVDAQESNMSDAMTVAKKWKRIFVLMVSPHEVRALYFRANNFIHLATLCSTEHFSSLFASGGSVVSVHCLICALIKYRIRWFNFLLFGCESAIYLREYTSNARESQGVAVRSILSGFSFFRPSRKFIFSLRKN